MQFTDSTIFISLINYRTQRAPDKNNKEVGVGGGGGGRGGIANNSKIVFLISL